MNLGKKFAVNNICQYLLFTSDNHLETWTSAEDFSGKREKRTTMGVDMGDI